MSGFNLKDVGGFAKKNALQIGSTAFNYKMGGTLGKVLAAGQTADLANRYNKEQKNKQKYQGQGDGSYAGSSGYASGGSSNYDPYAQQQGGYYADSGKQQQPYPKSGGGLSSVLSSGKDLLKKAEKTVKEKMDGGHKNSGSSAAYASGANVPAGGGYGGYAAPSPSFASPPQIMTYLPSGAVIRLISTVTGRPLQIVSSPTGSLVFDANGVDSPDSYNADFTVIKQEDRTICLHNTGNFIALNNGQLLVYPSGPANAPIGDCHLTVHEHNPAVISLQARYGNGAESVVVGPDGLPQFGSFDHPGAMFTVKFMFTPPPSYY